jgi:hypothetical protein
MQASFHVEPSTRKWTFAGKKTLHPSIKKLEYEEIKSGEFLRTGCLPPDVKIGMNVKQDIMMVFSLLRFHSNLRWLSVESL